MKNKSNDKYLIYQHYHFESYPMIISVPAILEGKTILIVGYVNHPNPVNW